MSTITITMADFQEQGKRAGWRFVCPNCGTVASIADFEEAGAPERAGQECIGRQVAGRGCNFAAYGLIPGPVSVVFPDGKTVRSFEFAEAVAS